MSNGIGGPFDITDRFGNDRLEIINKFAGPADQATEQVANRVAEQYRKAMLTPANPNESEQKVIIHNEDYFDVEVELYQPAAILTELRDARNKAAQSIDLTTSLSATVRSINVGVTGRDRERLAKNIYMMASTDIIVDADQKKLGEVESRIRAEVNDVIPNRIELFEKQTNLALNMGDNEYSLQQLIEAGGIIRQIVSDEFTARTNISAIAAGDNFRK